MKLELYTKELEMAVKAFNTRLCEGGEPEVCLPETYLRDFPKERNGSLYQESFLALEAGKVRGGYHLRHQKFSLRGKDEMIAATKNVVSEGIVNPAYTMVGVFLLRSALQKQPLLYALGMGGMYKPLPRLLKASGWALYPVPFHFKVVNPQSFLTNLLYLRRNNTWHLALDALGRTHLGAAGFRVLQFRLHKQEENGVHADTVAHFGQWTNELWTTSKYAYSLVAARDSETLNLLYPLSNSQFLRLRVFRREKTVGWAIMLDSPLSDHQYFGNMRVGSIVDCFASPENAFPTIASATRFLETRKVDLIVSNQTSCVWRCALARNGFLRGPSNFLLGCSPMLTERLQPFQDLQHDIHMNRGDGDGPSAL